MLIQKYLYLSYSSDEENRINEIINAIDSFDKIRRMNTVKESEIVLMFLTNKYFDSEKYKEDYESIRRENRTALFIFLDDFSTPTYLNNFKTIRLNDEIKKLKIFINPENISNQPINLRLASIKNYYEFEILEMISEEEVFFKRIMFTHFKVYNFNTGKIIEIKYKFKSHRFGPPRVDSGRIYCWIRDLQQIVNVSKENSSDRLAFIFYSLNGDVRNDDVLLDSKGFRVKSIKYNTTDEHLYLHVFYYKSIYNEIITIIDKNLNRIKNIENFSIYDLPFNYSNSIRFQSHDYKIFYQRGNFVVLEEITKRRDNLIFDLNSYSIIGSFKSTFKINIVLNNKLILSNDEGFFFIYRIEFRKSCLAIDPKYICKLNPFKQHLYLNPYLLPCNNSACWECICSHYSIYKGVFKCNFDDCKDKHELSQSLNQNLQLKQMMEDDSGIILKTFIENEKNWNYQG